MKPTAALAALFISACAGSAAEEIIKPIKSGREAVRGGAASRFPGRASTVAVAGDEAFVIGATREANGEREEPYLIRAPL